MKTLVTGASGFVGGFIRDKLDCVPLSSALHEVDLRDAAAVRDVVRQIQPEAVLHLASQSFVPESFERPRDTFEINFIGTFNLLQALKDSAFRGRMLFVGSGDAYGLVPESRLPITEEQPLHPRSPYSVSKVAAESLCYQWSQTEAFEIAITRSFNHLGPGQSDRFAVSNFAKQVIEIKAGRREPVIHVGDIDVTRDFTDVRDAADAYALLIERGRNGEAYNVCSGTEYSLRTLLHCLLELADVNARIEQDSARLRPSEQKRMCGSFEKLHRDTGWKPTTPLDRTLKDILQFWTHRLS